VLVAQPRARFVKIRKRKTRNRSWNRPCVQAARAAIRSAEECILVWLTDRP
jgi:Tfp pilus assembly protein PilX